MIHSKRMRRIAICALAFVIFPAAGTRFTAAKGAVSRQESKDQTDNGLPLPKIELKGKLSDIFTVTHCEYISGLTCRIHYNGKLPLPSQVFFTEFDARGHLAGLRVRLIYPELKADETGRATLRIRLARPTRIVFEGEWKGPWQDPY